MIINLVLLAIGLFILVCAADYLVKGAVGLAEKLGVSPLIIGLTIVAFGTSAPELFVSVQAASTGVPGLAVGNVVGSNIANILLVLGAPALMVAIATDEDGITKPLFVMIGISALFALLLIDGTISRFDGIILLGTLVGFLAWQYHRATRPKHARTEAADYADDVGETPHDNTMITVFLIGGLIGLPLGGHLTIGSATEIARIIGVGDAVIGLTLVAFGTSLPELATSVMAAWRRSDSIAIGNVIGSNIFNISLIMGVTSLITPVPVAARIVSVDVWFMLFVSVFLVALSLLRRPVCWRIGAAMLVIYVAYIVTAF